MSTLSELLAKKTALDQQIHEMQTTERANAIAKIHALMADHGLTPADLNANVARATKAKSSSTNKVAAKYRNTATGDSWSGRGLQPKWLKAALAAGRKVEEFAV